MESKRHDNSSDEALGERAFPGWLKLLVSLLLVVHFGLIGLTYFSNNSLKRMPIADQLLQKCHPYLIGLGWYTELLPMSLVGSESYDKPVGIDYKTDRDSRTWTSWIESESEGVRWKRLAQLIGALATNEDEEGLGQIALSLVRQARSSGLEFDQIRFTTKDPDSTGRLKLYQATIVPLVSGELTLVPEIEQTRTVPGSRTMTP